MFWLVIVLCLIGIYKGWNAFSGCVKSSAFIPAMNMLIMTILFLVIALTNLYILREYDINKKFNIETYGEFSE
jgi:hypothetical protein